MNKQRESNFLATLYVAITFGILLLWCAITFDGHDARPLGSIWLLLTGLFGVVYIVLRIGLDN